MIKFRGKLYRLVTSAFPQGDTYGAIVYHGSDASDLTDLEISAPPYEGGIGIGVYVDFDPAVALFYGTHLYKLKLLVHRDEIYWLEPHFIDEFSGQSILVGENIDPFQFELNGTWYAVMRRDLDNEGPVDLNAFVTELDKMLTSDTEWQAWFKYVPRNEVLANELHSLGTGVDKESGEVVRGEDLPRFDRISEYLGEETWEYLESLGLDLDRAAEEIDSVMDAFASEYLSAKSYGTEIDLDEIGGEVEAHGYKALYVDTIRPMSELLVFDASDLEMISEINPKTLKEI